MSIVRIAVLVIIILILSIIKKPFNTIENASAQLPTFGPICDTTQPGVTCVPTSTVAATATTRPTTPPTATPRPPVAGTTTNLIILLSVGGIFVLSGGLGLIQLGKDN